VFAIFGTDIGALVGGMDSVFAQAIYLLVALAALYELATHKKNCRDCAAKAGM